MKRIVFLVLALVLCVGGATAAVMVAKSRKDASLEAQKVETPTNTTKPPETTAAPVTQAPQVDPVPTVYGQDVFPQGSLVATKEDMGIAHQYNSSLQVSRVYLVLDNCKLNTNYGLCWTIDPHVFDLEYVVPFSFESDGESRVGVLTGFNTFFNFNGNAEDGLSSVLTASIDLGRNGIVADEDHRTLYFCPFLFSRESAPSSDEIAGVFQYVTLSVFELPAESVQ